MGDDDAGEGSDDGQSFTAQPRRREPAVQPRTVEELDVDDPRTLADPQAGSRSGSPPAPARPDASAANVDLPEPRPSEDERERSLPDEPAGHARDDVNPSPPTGPTLAAPEPRSARRHTRALEAAEGPPPQPPVADEPDALPAIARHTVDDRDAESFEVVDARVLDPEPTQPPAVRAPPPVPTLEPTDESPAAPETEELEAEEEAGLLDELRERFTSLGSDEDEQADERDEPGLFSRLTSQLRERFTSGPEPADVVFEVTLSRPPAPPIEPARKPPRGIQPVPLAADPDTLAGQPDDVASSPPVVPERGSRFPARPETRQRLEADPRRLLGSDRARGAPPRPEGGQRVPARPKREVDPQAVAQPTPARTGPPGPPERGRRVPARPAIGPVEGVPGRPGGVHDGPAPEPEAGEGQAVPGWPSSGPDGNEDWTQTVDPETLDRQVDGVLTRYERGSDD
jgi:hypothetical protein